MDLGGGGRTLDSGAAERVYDPHVKEPRRVLETFG